MADKRTTSMKAAAIIISGMILAPFICWGGMAIAITGQFNPAVDAAAYQNIRNLGIVAALPYGGLITLLAMWTEGMFDR